MRIFQKKGYQFEFKTGFFCLVSSLLILCCVLGVWQLKRYDYKNKLIQHYESNKMAPELGISFIHTANDLQFKKVAVTGYYLNKLTMLVQNRFYHGQLGYEVLTPLRIAHEKKLLLVDRGWIKQSNDVALSIPEVEQSIRGYLKLNEHSFILGANILQPKTRPLVMQRIEIDELSRLTHESYFPFILRLDPALPNGFIRDWVIVTVLPARHLAYAIQWFLFAFILLIGYFCVSLKRENSA